MSSQSVSPRIAAVYALGMMLLVLGAGRVGAAGVKPLAGHVPAAANTGRALGRLPATNELHLAIGVALRDPAGLEQFLTAVYTPGSPNYRHFLTSDEFTARFGASAADFAAAKRFALTNGFKIESDFGGRMLISVTAKAGDVERAFHVRLNRFQHPTEAREFFAPDTEPTVDASLPLLDVQGLNNFERPHPKLKKMDPNLVVPKSGSGSGGSYLGDDFRNAYAPGTALNGSGQQVGLLQFDGFYASDISSYATLAGGGRSSIVVQAIFTDTYTGTPGSGNGEVSLDIEMAMAMAPALSKILVFEADPSTGNPNTIFAAMVTNTAVKQLSCSWGWSGGVDATSENYFKQMAAQGQSFFNASGDSDAFLPGQLDNASQTTYPSCSANITQVGGTTLTMNGAGASYSSETVWNWGGGTGSSGGISSNAIPTWQRGINMANNGGSWTGRNVPDVALTGDNVYVKYGNGTNGIFGGTSCAAPLWAGFMALVNQQMATVTGSATNAVGFLNPAAYEIARQSSYSTAFHDTTSGNNTWASSPSSFFATAGYDLCTGLGTPSGTNIINALVVPDSLVIISNFGFSATGYIGGPFSPTSQIFTLTNVGASSLNWSIINTSAWLTVSSSSGALVAATTTTASLTAGANALPVGMNTAVLLFSNATTKVTHYRLFTVNVLDAMQLLTTNGFAAVGGPGGPFYPGSQTVVITNTSATSLSWSLINTSSWLSASVSSGSIAGNSSTSLTVSTNSGVRTLTNGTYAATLIFSNQSSHATQTLVITAAVGQNLVQNPGFETGDFTSWTMVGDTTYTVIANGAAHSGSYGVASGQAGSAATVSQTLPTSPGQKYLLSFWLANPTGGTTESFQAVWNGTNAYNLLNPGVLGWINPNVVVSAGGTSTVLQFAMQNDPYYFYLDDISVVPVNAPIVLQQPVGQTNIVGGTAVLSAIVTGTAPFTYQWRTNGINLGNNSIVSGATSNILTLTGLTSNNSGNYTLVTANSYGSITSSVAVLAVGLRTNSTPVISQASLQGGAINLQLAGGYGQTYILEARTNLTAGSWAPIATNTMGYAGTWQFNDSGVTTKPSSFYRLRLGP